ncbi:MAG: hypothetical protein ACLU3I_21950 [Acutalibacteraceae bacterium]
MLEQIDEHTTRLRLGGEITYMGKYSYIEYTGRRCNNACSCCDGNAHDCLYIENGVIAAVSWMAPE